MGVLDRMNHFDPSAPIFLSTAYLPPIQYFTKLLHPHGVVLEGAENFVKQSYRNRCHIAGPEGLQPLTVPVEKSPSPKSPIRDIRISDHGNWRHLHLNALISSYGSAPFFDYYITDLEPFYTHKYTFLWEFNLDLLSLCLEWLDIAPLIMFSFEYTEEPPNDYRYTIRPKQAPEDEHFIPTPYYQTFARKYGFMPHLSIVDLIFHEGPAAILTLQRSIR